MTKAQKRVLMIGLLLMAAAALFPPRHHVGGYSRGFLYSGESIHFMRLVVEWMFLAALTGAMILMADAIAIYINRNILESSDKTIEIKPIDDEPEEDENKPFGLEQ